MAYKKRYYKKRSKPGIIDSLINFMIFAIWGLLSTVGRVVLLLIQTRYYRNISNKAGTPSTTLKGEKVRSKTEKRIADWLYQNNIPYIYEKPLHVSSFSSIYPDFYLTLFDTYIEYYGLMEHPSIGKKYRKAVRFKQKIYAEKGIKVIELDHNHQKYIESHLQRSVSYLKRV